jgi:serine/threonine-protein kinase
VDPLLTSLTDQLRGRYTLERLLGKGGMATVYLARDLKHDRPVALKVLTPETARAIGTERFEREIRLAARLQHPHICSVYDSGEAGTMPEGSAPVLFFTMPFVDGESVEARLQRTGPFPVDDALRIAQETAQALAHAHAEGVIHRDIKPANLLLTNDSSTLVADFGIARAVGASRSDAERTLTEVGYSPGTPAYMSPEQRAGAGDLDGRSDIYSLGLVLYEMLVGERPYPDTWLALFAQAMSDPLPRVHSRRAEVPDAVDRILARALALDPAARYQSMTEFGAALEELRRGAGGAAQRSAGARDRLVAGVGLVLLLVVGAYLATRHGAAGSADDTTSKSAAVLPFTDQSPAQDQAYFSGSLGSGWQPAPRPSSSAARTSTCARSGVVWAWGRCSKDPSVGAGHSSG